MLVSLLASNLFISLTSRSRLLIERDQNLNIGQRSRAMDLGFSYFAGKTSKLQKSMMASDCDRLSKNIFGDFNPIFLQLNLQNLTLFKNSIDQQLYRNLLMLFELRERKSV